MPILGRGTATEQQLAAVDAEIAKMREEGTNDTDLTLKWRCRLNSYRNHKGDLRGLCYWDGEVNKLELYVPINRNHLLAWSEKISKDEATPQLPLNRIYRAIVRAKESSRTAHGENLLSSSARCRDPDQPF